MEAQLVSFLHALRLHIARTLDQHVRNLQWTRQKRGIAQCNVVICPLTQKFLHVNLVLRIIFLTPALESQGPLVGTAGYPSCKSGSSVLKLSVAQWKPSIVSNNNRLRDAMSAFALSCVTGHQKENSANLVVWNPSWQPSSYTTNIVLKAGFILHPPLSAIVPSVTPSPGNMRPDIVKKGVGTWQSLKTRLVFMESLRQ